MSLIVNSNADLADSIQSIQQPTLDQQTDNFDDMPDLVGPDTESDDEGSYDGYHAYTTISSRADNLAGLFSMHMCVNTDNHLTP